MKAGVKPGDDIMSGLNPRPMQIQIDDAERLGLGTRKYELVWWSREKRGDKC